MTSPAASCMLPSRRMRRLPCRNSGRISILTTICTTLPQVLPCAIPADRQNAESWFIGYRENCPKGAFPMTQNQQPGSICAEEYTVKRGDSFYLIAHKLGVPLRDLLAANRDIHPARLMVGDVLCIPREADDSIQNGPGSGSGNTGSNGTVNGGEMNGINNDGLPGTNDSSPDQGSTGLSCPIDEQVTIQQGETVADIQLQSLLSRNTLQTANPSVDLDTLSAGQTICVPRENVACTLPSTYTLVQGETLETVAMRFNLPLASLLRVNPCLAPQDFEEGVTVILPR
ncbi:MAG: LysM peptidoglycan-binding domain-containing protein [Clostridiales bacterium]|nr:LysM peptidoglycan-binding domain-containing protein [Clostridiales bacterium]